MFNKAIFLLFLLHLYGQYVHGVKNDTMTCHIGMTKESIDEARQKFDEYRNSGMRLVNIYLAGTKNVTEIFDKNLLDPKEKNSIAEWIWSSAAATFDLQLPVDIDAATFGIMKVKQDDIDITLELLNDSENCTFNTSFTEEKVFDILFNNVTINGVNGDDFLCKRIFENQAFKKWTYYWTGIWIGYDFRCFSIGNNGTTISTVFKKSSSTIIVYIIEVVVILLYPFVFAFLYVGPNNGNSYEQGETPYGIRRVTRRIFHYNVVNTKSMWEPYVPVLRFTFLCCLVVIPLVSIYGYFFKKFIKNYNEFEEVYKFNELTLYGPFLPLFSFHWYLAQCLEKFPNQIWIFNTYFLFNSSPNRTYITNIDLDQISNFRFYRGLAKNLIIRGSMIFSFSFWKTLWSNVFCPPVKSCRHWLILPLHIIFNLIFLALDILSCISPFFWIFCTYILSWYGIVASKMRRSQHPYKHFDVIFFGSVFFLFLIPFVYVNNTIMFLFMPIAYVTRIITYTLFIAIPSFEAANFQRFLMILAGVTYAFDFLHSFLELYKTLLNEMFKINNSSEQNPKISERDFDLIASKIFPVGAQVGKLLLKIFLMASGIAISSIVLIESKHVESSTQNLLQILVIALSPGVFVKLFITSSEEKVKQKKDQIIEAMELTEMGDTSSDTDTICDTRYGCFRSTFCCCCNSNTSVSGENQFQDYDEL